MIEFPANFRPSFRRPLVAAALLGGVVTLTATDAAKLQGQSEADALAAAEHIAEAVAQSPARLRGEPTLIRWNADHTYEVLREGTNDLVCYDRSEERNRPPFAAQCTHQENLERVAQNRRFRAATSNAEEELAMIEAAEEDGTRVLPKYGSLFYRMDGADMESALLHATIAVPGATAEGLGLPDNPTESGAWLMDGGSSAAHIMIPGR